MKYRWELSGEVEAESASEAAQKAATGEGAQTMAIEPKPAQQKGGQYL